MLIQTEDFEVYLLKENEGHLFFALIDENRNRLEDFFAGTVAKTKNLESCLNYCVLIQERILKKEYFPFVVRDVKSNGLIGLIDVKNINWNIPKAELGCFIDSYYANSGIASQLLPLFVEKLVQQYRFKKLLCRISPDNPSSIQVALKSGFEFEGTIRRDYKTTSGKIVDVNYYGKIF